MIPPLHREPGRDERIAGALRNLSGPPAGDDGALAARIVAAARPALAARRRAPRPWWEWTASWARIAVPVGVAASLAAGALVLLDDTGVADASLTESALVLEGGGGAEGTELAAELLPQPTDEWLFLAAGEP